MDKHDCNASTWLLIYRSTFSIFDFKISSFPPTLFHAVLMFFATFNLTERGMPASPISCSKVVQNDEEGSRTSPNQGDEVV